jgi:hypothetical protein
VEAAIPLSMEELKKQNQDKQDQITALNEGEITIQDTVLLCHLTVIFCRARTAEEQEESRNE